MDGCFYENEFGCRYPERSTRQTVSSKDGAKRKEKKVSPMNNLKEKRRQGQLTTKWLKQNYCACPDVCLPREIVYEQYLEFCRREKIFPACKATFGKLIRSTFPEVSSKRLGARGHSKYHYNGIGMKPSSEFRSVSSGTEGVTRFSVLDNDTEQKNLKKFSPSSKVGTLLPNFPDAENLIIPVSGDKTKEMMATFILMYKTHCQCIVDVVIGGNFEEIRLFLLHFWQGFPEHLMSLKDLDVFLYVVAFCDCILYRTLLDVLIPPVSFEMPEKLLRSIHNIGTHWSLWVQCSLENMPDKLLEVKMASAKRFCRSLKRCVAFMHLLQVNRPILSSDAPLLLAKELEELSQEIKNHNWCSNIEEEMGSNENLLLTTEHTKEFQNILKQCGSVNLLIEYLDKMILNIKGWNEDQTSARNFVFNWVYMLSKLSYLLTENRSRYFITFHLLSSLIQEYLLLAVETHLEKDQEKYIHDRLNKHLKNVGSFTSESFKPTTSCFLVNKKSHSLRNHVSKQRQKKTQASVGLAESQLPRMPYLTGTKTYPKTCTYYLRTETGQSSQELPSCKYASSSCHGNTVYDVSLSCLTTRDQSSVRVLNPHQPGHVTNSICGNVNSPDGFTTPQFEFYQLERNPCSSFPHRTYTNHEYYPWNQR